MTAARSTLSYRQEHDYQTYMQTNNDSELLAIYIRKSSYVQTYIAKFKSIGDTVAVIGGFWNACYLILRFCARYYGIMILCSELQEFDQIKEIMFTPIH